MSAAHRPTRRSGLAALVALATPLAGVSPASGQAPGRRWRIGWLSPTSRQEPYAQALVQRLAELGYVEGRNLVIEFRSRQADAAAFQAMAEELGRLRCDLYLGAGNVLGLRALLQGTHDAPIVVVANDFDPVAAGFVASLARPGGRITGVSQLQAELPSKRLDLARELLPGLKRVAVLADAVTADQLRSLRAAALQLGLTLVVHEFSAPPYPLGAAFERFTAARTELLLPLSSGLLATQRRAIVEHAQARRLPAIFPSAVWVDAGGLMSYGPDFSASYRRAAEMVARLLAGADPATLPMEQPNTVELVLNQRTARALGLVVPPALRLRADRVVE